MDVRLEDGTIVKNVPEGMTQEELMARLNRPKASGVGYAGMAPRADVMGGFGGLVRGARDPVDAGAQLAVRAANAIGLAPQSEVARVEGINKAAEEDYRQNWRGGNPPPIDIPRILGAGAVLGPAAAPREVAATLGGRMLQAGKAGTVGGAMTPVPEPKDNSDFFLKKGGQAAIGGVTGLAAQPAMEGLFSGVSQIAASVANRTSGAVKGVMGELSEEAARRIAYDNLRAQGINFNNLNEAVQKSLVSDVREAMKKYGGVSGAALGRQADFKSLGVDDPLKAWVTRDPVDFGRMKNLEATDAGDALKQARAGLDRKLLDNIEGVRGVNTGDAYQSGDIAGRALKSAHAGKKAQVEGLYDAFRTTAPDVAADPKRMVNTILDSVEKDALGDFLGPLRNLINDFATGKRPTTPDSLYRAQQVANAVVRKGGPEGMAARRIVEGIDNELEQMGRDMSAVGPDMANAAELLKKARGAHRSLKMAEESIPALKAVADGSYAAEDFLSRYVVGADVKEVAAMWAGIKSTEMKQAARSQMVDALKKAGAADETAPFKAESFRKFVESPGMKQKLQIILGEGGKELVERVQRAATAAISVPSGARYNTSGSAMELLNLSRRIPGVGPLAADPLKGLADEMAVRGAMKSGPDAFGKGLLDPFAEDWLRRSRRLSGLLGPAVGGAAASGISQ